MPSVSNMSGHIVSGNYSNISQFPHSAFIAIDSFVCGSSIINQVLLLTAAHCVYEDPNPDKIIAIVGDKNRKKGLQHKVLSMIVHENYHDKYIYNDIALLRLKKKLEFGKNVAKVILLPDPPYNEMASVAGWGVTDENGGPTSEYLKHLSQKVYKGNECRIIGLKSVPQGTICGEHILKEGHPDRGDSGSALVVREYIQIGIVSFNRRDVSKTNTVFSDTGYFYKWIKKNANKLYCNT